MAMVFSVLGYFVKGRSVGLSFLETVLIGSGFVAVVFGLGLLTDRIGK